jgi:hypothetical protein
MEEEKNDDSEEWPEYEDSDGDSSEGYDDESDSDSSGGGFDQGSGSENDEEGLESLSLKRVESKAMCKDYPFHVLELSKVKGVLASKLLEISQEFEYANLSDFIVWKTFKDHGFVTKDTKSYLQDKVLSMMEKYTKKEPVGEPGENGELEYLCNLCFMPATSLQQAKHF